MKNIFSRTIFLPLLVPVVFTACNSAGSTALAIDPVTRADPSGRRLLQVENLHELRAAHSATLLPDGRVLIAAGFRKGPDTYSQLYSSTAELYDPAKRTFTYTGSLHIARCGQTATLLAGGKEVLITGGNNDQERLPSAELYDVRTGQWTRLPDMLAGREGHRAILLKNGKVLIIGGTHDPELSVELFDPATRKFEKTGPSPYDLNSMSAIGLADGRILLAGGLQGKQPTQSALICDPATSQFTKVGNMNSVRYKCGEILLADGKVMIIGGSDNRDWKGKYSSTEIFDPHTGTFSRGPELNFERFKLGHSVVTLRDGTVLVTGGDKHIELYDPASSKFTVVATLDQPYYFSSATLLTDGTVLMSGGYGNDAQPTSKNWLFQPGR
ncbi:MAG TPA: kelch repeat-containing protein [Puia sp.]|nr:kelch repeat-containing protein [Puia sp.]